MKITQVMTKIATPGPGRGNRTSPTVRREPAADQRAPGMATRRLVSDARVVSLNHMVRLELSDDEAHDLETALTAQLHILRAELSKADIRHYKHDLRERLDRLEQIAARLEHEAEADRAEPPDAWVPVG